MIPVLRFDQREAKQNVLDAWAGGEHNVMLKMDTGTGKTVTFCDIVRENEGMSVVLAHRDQLVGQASLALARYGVRHRIIAAKETIKSTVSAHIIELGADYYDPRALVAVVSVDTFIKLKPHEREWLGKVTLFVPDEAHHVLRENKWGKAYAMLTNPRLRSLMPTATPGRPDGKGLGRHADGIADILILGTTLQDMIDRGERSPFTIYAPPSKVDVSEVDVSKTTGDFNESQLRDAIHKKSKELVGDLVDHYLKYTPGLIGATFAVDVEEAGKIAAAYRQRGVPTEVISAGTPLTVRAHIMRRLKAGELKQVVSVDILGEGTDVPALEVVSFGRPTDSFIVYSQQAGRCRGMHGAAYILDAVGNVIRHDVPTAPRKWSLDRRERRGGGMDDAIPLTTCLNCFKPYQIIKTKCPHCDQTPKVVIVTRAGLKQVDGDLVLLCGPDQQAMRDERAAVDGAFMPDKRQPEAGQIAARSRHRKRQEAQKTLRHTMSVWMGWQNLNGHSDREAQKLFYIRYKIDYLSAQMLWQDEANELNERIRTELNKNNIQEATS